MTKKLDKQSERNIDFTFDNVSAISSDMGSKSKINDEKKMVNINFNLKKSLSEQFSKFLFETMVHVNTSISNSEMITLGVDFLKKEFISKKTFKESPNFFSGLILKTGRRKKTSRTPEKNEAAPIQGRIKEETLQGYLSLLYSYYSDKDVINTSSSYLSTAYFFHDFFEMILSKRKTFLKFVEKEIKS